MKTFPISLFVVQLKKKKKKAVTLSLSLWELHSYPGVFLLSKVSVTADRHSKHWKQEANVETLSFIKERCWHLWIQLPLGTAHKKARGALGGTKDGHAPSPEHFKGPDSSYHLEQQLSCHDIHPQNSPGLRGRAGKESKPQYRCSPLRKQSITYYSQFIRKKNAGTSNARCEMLWLKAFLFIKLN